MSNIVKYYETESILNENIHLNDYNKSLDTLLEMLSIKMDINDYPPVSLTENIFITNNFSEYIPLIEAVDQISSFQKDLSKLSKSNDSEKDTIFRKCISSFKSLIDWWYKIEPNKKFKTLHTILKLLVKVLLIIANIYISVKVSNKVLNTKAISNIPDKILSIGKRKISLKKNVVKFLTGYGLDRIYEFTESLTTKKIELSVNIKDIDKNIDELDKDIDKLNDMIAKIDDGDIKNALIQTRNEFENSLSKLMKLKSRNENK